MGDANDDMLVVIAHVAVGISDGDQPEGKGCAAASGKAAGEVMDKDFEVTELEGMTQALFIAAGFVSCPMPST